MIDKLKQMLRGLLLGGNLCVIFLLWISVLSTYLSPAVFSRLSLLGLLFPIFLLINVAYFFFWLTFRVRLLWVPLLGLAAAYTFIVDYCPLHLNRNTERTDSMLCVYSYNIGGMKDVSKEERDSLLRHLSRLNPDIICFQEAPYHWVESGVVKEWADATGYRRVSQNGNYILSRLPIVGRRLKVDYATHGNSSVACWIRCMGDSVLLINNHLESNRLTDEEKSAYKNTVRHLQKDSVKQNGRLLISKLGEAARFRGPQADTLSAIVSRNQAYPIIMCGDFNDTPISYTYRKISHQLTSAFRESGCGMGFSYRQWGFPVRIDHIFYSPHWESTYTYIDRQVYVSDHYPIVTYLRKKRK